jgi:Flp pilus assembly protein TadD
MNGFNQGAISHQLKRGIGAILVGMLLVLTVACSSPNVPMSSGTGAYNEKIGSKTDLRDGIQPKQGGMNGYDDDINASSPQLQAKTRTLVDTAKRNLGKTADRKDIPKTVLKSAENLKDDISEGAEKQKNDFVQGSKNGMRNLSGNLNKASREIPKVVKEATENAKDSVRQSADSAKETVDILRQNIDNAG